MKRVWMPLYIADYLKDTTHLGVLESGAYLHLIMAYWASGGRLPNDDKQLATIAKMSMAQWRKAKATLAAFFGTGWTHKRIDVELKKAADQAERAAERGRKGAEARYSKDASSIEQAKTEDAPSPSPSQSKKDIRAVARATPSDNPLFERFWRAYPKRKGANPRLPAQKAWERAVRLGADPGQLFEAIAAYHGMDPDKIGTEFIPRATTWLNERRWEGFKAPEAELTEERIVWMAARGYAWLDGKWTKVEGAFNSPPKGQAA